VAATLPIRYDPVREQGQADDTTANANERRRPMKRTALKMLLARVALGAFALSAVTPAWADNDKKNHNPPGHSKHRDDDRGKGGGHGHDKARGGPPAWAPAWGYRGKEKLKYKRGARYYEVEPASLVQIGNNGFGTCNRDVIGAILGGAAGAAAGSQFGKGDGKIFTTVGGAIIGALIGGNLGQAMDQTDQNCVGQILERAPNDSTVAWRDPDRQRQYQVTPTRTYQTPSGAYCREYQTQIVIDGRIEDAFGAACREPDGSWKKS
jgi:surface antigen/Ni/Co efflux regulator RcnB